MVAVSSEFWCGKGDLCFNQGVCLTTNESISFCLCENGTTNDLSLFHDPSCTMPQEYFRGLFIEQTCVNWLIILLLLKALPREREKLKWALFWAILGSLSMWLISAGLYFQDGSFEIAGFFFFSCIVFSTLTALELILAQLAALDGLGGIVEYRSFVRNIRVSVVVSFVDLTLLMILWMIFCRTLLHNRIVMATLFSLVLINSIFGWIIGRGAGKLADRISKLQTTLSDQGNATSLKKQDMWADVVKRFKRLRLAVIVGCFLVQAGVLPLILMHFILGSTPYAWVFFLAVQHSSPVLGCGVIFLARRGIANEQHPDSHTARESARHQVMSARST